MKRKVKQEISITKRIMETHERLKKLNRNKVEASKCEYNGFFARSEFVHNGKKITIVQVVNEFNGYCKYAICYFEDDKLIGHNIRYVQRLYEDSCNYYMKRYGRSIGMQSTRLEIAPKYKIIFKGTTSYSVKKSRGVQA